MDHEQWLELNTPPHQRGTIDAGDLGRPDRTIALGTTRDHHTWHLYLDGGQLHRLVFDELSNKVVEYLASPRWQVAKLVPDHRLWPESTDYSFARVLRRHGVDAAYWAFSLERYASVAQLDFHAPVFTPGIGGIHDHGEAAATEAPGAPAPAPVKSRDMPADSTSVWAAFTPAERSRWEERTLDDLATPDELRLLGEVATELGHRMYEFDVLGWGDEPVLPSGEDSPGAPAIALLPRCSDRQDQAWRARMARAFCDVAEDLRAGRAPIPRCHAEDLALRASTHSARVLVDEVRTMVREYEPVGSDEEELDPADYLARRFPLLGRVSVQGQVSFRYTALEDALLLTDGTNLLFGDDQGRECPDHPLSWQAGSRDLRAERWFDAFESTLPRDPERGFPVDVWSGLSGLARTRLAQEAARAGTGPLPLAAGRRPDEGAALGTVSAANYMVAAWRQQVLAVIGRDVRAELHGRPIVSPEQAWDIAGRAVLSDVPAVALEQARRLIPQAVAGGGGQMRGIYWARPAPVGYYYPPAWFWVKVCALEEHPTDTRDVPRMLLQWANGSQSAVPFSEIVAIRRTAPREVAWAPWEPLDGELALMPTLDDFHRSPGPGPDGA